MVWFVVGCVFDWCFKSFCFIWYYVMLWCLVVCCLMVLFVVLLFDGFVGGWILLVALFVSCSCAVMIELLLCRVSFCFLFMLWWG